MFWVLIFFAKIVFLQSNIQTIAGYAVAPYVGAWIETANSRLNKKMLESHPMWVRGLKLIAHSDEQQCGLSHPMWVRGLKQTFHLNQGIITSRTLCGCVD